MTHTHQEVREIEERNEVEDKTSQQCPPQSHFDRTTLLRLYKELWAECEKLRADCSRLQNEIGDSDAEFYKEERERLRAQQDVKERGE